jgi:hypothetical protein
MSGGEKGEGGTGRRGVRSGAEASYVTAMKHNDVIQRGLALMGVIGNLGRAKSDISCCVV